MDNLDDPEIIEHGWTANQIVFSFWLPHPRDFQQLDFSQWQQNLLGVLLLEIKYDKDVELGR